MNQHRGSEKSLEQGVVQFVLNARTLSITFFQPDITFQVLLSLAGRFTASKPAYPTDRIRVTSSWLICVPLIALHLCPYSVKT